MSILLIRQQKISTFESTYKYLCYHKCYSERKQLLLDITKTIIIRKVIKLAEWKDTWYYFDIFKSSQITWEYFTIIINNSKEEKLCSLP